MRLVVPDLEAIARHYLRLLDLADAGAVEAQADYDWILLELFDQMVRTDSGGEMHRLLTSGAPRNRGFVIERAGPEAERLLAREQDRKPIVRPGLRHYLRRMREEAAVLLAALVLGRWAGGAVREGLFRASGQVHLWMYDRFSLRRLLEQCGFVDVRRCGAIESRIPDFAKFELDSIDARVRKPDSLFMEATKP